MLPPQCKGGLVSVCLYFVLKHQLNNSGSSWVFTHVYACACSCSSTGCLVILVTLAVLQEMLALGLDKYCLNTKFPDEK